MPTVVNSVAYRNGKRLADIPLRDISDVIKEPNTFVWLGLHESDASVLLQIQEEFSLHDLAIEDARKAHQRSKIESYGDSLFIVVKTAQLRSEAGDALGTPGDSEEAGQDCTIEYGETHLFVGLNFLVSVRHGNAHGYAEVRKRCEEKPEMLSKGPAFALYSLLDFIVDNYQPIVGRLSREFEALEVNIFRGQFDQLSIEGLYELKIKLLELRQAALPLEDICLQLMRLHPEIIHKDLREYFRDIHDHVARTIETLDGLREMLTTAMSVHLALVSVRQNEIVKRLAGWGAILAVPTVVFSLYGMNFNNMPELRWHYAYPAMLLATLAVCGMFYRKLKKAGWL